MRSRPWRRRRPAACRSSKPSTSSHSRMPSNRSGINTDRASPNWSNASKPSADRTFMAPAIRRLMAVLLMIVLTFFGAATCYRVGLHMRVSFFVSLLPERLQRATALLVELLMALIALFMVDWGSKLVAATWQNSIADFPSLSVGVTYLPIPLGGAILLLFVFERLAIGPPPPPAERGAVA